MDAAPGFGPKQLGGPETATRQTRSTARTPGPAPTEYGSRALNGDKPCPLRPKERARPTLHGSRLRPSVGPLPGRKRASLYQVTESAYFDADRVDSATKEWIEDFEFPAQKLFYKRQETLAMSQRPINTLDAAGQDWLSGQEFPTRPVLASAVGISRRRQKMMCYTIGPAASMARGNRYSRSHAPAQDLRERDLGAMRRPALAAVSLVRASELPNGEELLRVAN